MAATQDEGEAPPIGSGGEEGRGSEGSKQGAHDSPQHGGPRKEARRSGGDCFEVTAADRAEAQAASPGRTPSAATEADQHGTVSYRLHASVLASSSTYFKKRILQQSTAGLRYADGGCSIEHGAAAGPQLTRCVLVEHLEEGEVEAMEAVLRHAYTGTLCAQGCDAAQVTVATLLQMLVLSDRFDVTPCLAHCCEELATRSAADFDWPAVNAVLSGCPGGWHAVPVFLRVRDIAEDRLLHNFGDAEAVAEDLCDTECGVEAQLQQLSLPALLLLLSSERLQSRSENSVLHVAGQWLTGSVPRHCSDAELRQVAAVLRLGRLTHSFTFHVLPHLAWLQISPAERESLLLFSAAGDEGPRNLAGRTDRQEHLLQRGRLAGPLAWFSSPPRPLPEEAGEVAFDSSITREELRSWLLKAKADDTASCNRGLWLYFNGFSVNLNLYVDGAAGAEGARLGCTVDTNILELVGHGHGVRVAVKCGIGTPGAEALVTEFAGVCESKEVFANLQLFAVPFPGV